MSGDAVAALAEGMAAARQGGGGGGGGKGGGAKRSSMDGPSQHDPPTGTADLAAEALGEEIWGLMDLLVDHLYDPDEQARNRAVASVGLETFEAAARPA